MPSPTRPRKDDAQLDLFASPADELPAGERRRLTPTDVSQFLRLDRCERFLRLRLHERRHGRGFLKALDVVGQEPPPIVTRAGSAFEARIVERLTERFPSRSFAAVARSGDDNAALCEAVRALAPGEALLTLQPRLEARPGFWELHGDPDLILWRRDEAGGLSMTLVDVKSSPAPKVEHRLQVAFYEAMLGQILGDAGIETAHIERGILYRGPADPDSVRDESERSTLARDAESLTATLGIDGAFFQPTTDPDAYAAEVEALVTGPRSAAERIAGAPVEGLFFALGSKCDACLYSEWCMTRAHDDSDLALTPYLSGRDKKALLAAGVRTVHDLARLKDLSDEGALAPAAGAGPTLGTLAAGSAGARIDELVLRARAARKVRLPTLPWLPDSGHPTLPHTAPDHNPNLVTVIVDAQLDPVEGRAWLLASQVIAHAAGEAVRKERIVGISDGPPDTAQKEAALFADWIRRTLSAVVSLAEPDENAQPSAPLHVIFWNEAGQTQLLDALARNLGAMVDAAPALYDFLTQIAAFDSPAATFLADEVRQRRNLPMLCQSLTSIASYLKFDWGATARGEALRRRFYERLFDTGGEREGERYERRSRHSSQIPVEYAYAAWDALEPPGRDDPFRPYRGTTLGDLEDLARLRLDAIAHIAGSMPGNALTRKTPFALPDLATFDDVAPHLARALREFLTIERHAFLTAWKDARQRAPERRALGGETLLVSYREADQDPEVAAANRENARRRVLREELVAAWRVANPEKRQVRLPKDQDDVSRWSMAGMALRLRLETAGTDADLATLRGVSTLREGDRLILSPRWTLDERKAEADRTPFTPTPKQLLYGTRVELKAITIEGDDAFAEVVVCGPGGVSAGYLFNAIDRPLEPGALFTLDADPNDIYGLWQKKAIDALCEAEGAGEPVPHAFYRRVAARDLSPVPWPADAAEGQARFLLGLDDFHSAGLLHGFEESKRAYIGSHGDAPILLVQGPPGTGKSYSTAFAVLARLQGALAAGEPLRVLLSCKTHSATDVLIRGVAEALETLDGLRGADPERFARWFDQRLLSVPLLRLAGKNPLSDRIEAVPKDARPKPAERLAAHEHCVAATTPGGVYSLITGKWKATDLLGHGLCELLVLDEASQMGLPEAMIAALPLHRDGRVIVVGDPRQMPPIVQHAWESEARRTFDAFQTYQSLFDAMAALTPPFLQFAESFRLHAAMARFLRDTIYIHDGIDYRSRRTGTLAPPPLADPFAAAVLDPDFPLVVVLHDEVSSQSRNVYEAELIGPILRALSDPEGLGLSARDGMGVVVPHRAQRALLRQSYPELCLLDAETGEVLLEAVDTVERYQGDEREAILISATESDPEYLAASAGFLLDPRRLTVALSRAKKKLVLVASRSVFEFFTADETLFAHAQLWKSLRRRACTSALWQGERGGKAVEVWGGR